MQEAVNKIQSEMEKFKKNPLAQVLGKYLAEECGSSETIAESVMKNEKTLKDLAEHITAYAKKKATGGMAMIAKEEVFAETLKFYGTKAAVTKSAENVIKEADSVPEPVKSVTKKANTKPKNNQLEKNQVTFFDLGMGV